MPFAQQSNWVTFLFEQGDIFIRMFKFKALLEEISYPNSNVAPEFIEFAERVQELVGKQLEYKVKEYDEDDVTQVSFFYNSELVYSRMITVTLDSEKIEELATKAANEITERIEAMAFGQTEYDKMEMWVANVIPNVIKSLPKGTSLYAEQDNYKKTFSWTLQGSRSAKTVTYTVKNHKLTFLADPFTSNAKHFSKNIFKDFDGDPKVIANFMANFFA